MSAQLRPVGHRYVAGHAGLEQPVHGLLNLRTQCRSSLVQHYKCDATVLLEAVPSRPQHEAGEAQALHLTQRQLRPPMVVAVHVDEFWAEARRNQQMLQPDLVHYLDQSGVVFDGLPAPGVQKLISERARAHVGTLRDEEAPVLGDSRDGAHAVLPQAGHGPDEGALADAALAGDQQALAEAEVHGELLNEGSRLEPAPCWCLQGHLAHLQHRARGLGAAAHADAGPSARRLAARAAPPALDVAQGDGELPEPAHAELALGAPSDGLAEPCDAACALVDQPLCGNLLAQGKAALQDQGAQHAQTNGMHPALEQEIADELTHRLGHAKLQQRHEGTL
mmetsp:Transcript_60686/g.198650  ORF Transcript_60686/g.198650 Transcript_60686/m.198650 type:complete len:336 (-) Transcript_60686:3051-4058(-)